MINENLFNIIGLISGVIGTAIIAFSLGKFLKLIVTALGAFQESIISIVNPNVDVYVFKNIDNQLEVLRNISKKRIVIGLLFIILSFIGQIINIFI